MSGDPDWKYINIGRLIPYKEESIDEDTQWAVFEPDHEARQARKASALDG